MIDIALKAVKEASKLSLLKFSQHKKISFKANEEIVTQVDVEAERKIKAIIHNAYPNHKILGEEEGQEDRRSEYLWMIDPIDGTVNYSRGIKLYGVSVALARGKKVILGVVQNPITGENFRAELGKGAYLNGRRITVSKEGELSKVVVYATELYKTKDIISPLFDKVKQLRVTSSSAYEACLVAAGRTEAFIKVTTHPWGFAAAGLIVEEAGGKVTNFDKTDWSIDSTRILISNGVIHDKILSLMNK